MFRRKIVFSIVLALFLILPSVQAQDLPPIAYGDSLRGQIEDSAQGVVYTFEAKAGDRVVADAESNSIDVYMRLGNSNGDIVAENDDISQSNLNAHIEFTIEEDGVYLLAVLGYSTGPYTVTLVNASGSSQDSSQTNQNVDGLTYGSEVSSSAVDMQNPVVFSFSGEAGDNVVITAQSSDVDTYLVLADANGNSLAENDDISQDNTNAQIQTSLPANGDYLIGVYGYTSGAFTLSLDTNSGSTPTQPVSDTGIGGDVTTGQINNDQYYVQIPLNGVREGDTIVVDARATSGNLDGYLGLFLGDTVVAENDDRAQGDSDPLIEYPKAQAGDYMVVVTRYGFQDGETSGSFEVAVKVNSGNGSTLVTNTQPVTSNPVASGYPEISPTANIADWTILYYVGADNNLEDAMLNDINEFELAGGSNSQVKIVALVDRSEEFDSSNGDWTDTRLMEVGRDTSRDHTTQFPPTVDSVVLADLGELDTSYGNNLLDFLVWGIESYPAQHYAVILNDHGGGWLGTVVDDASGGTILSIGSLDRTFKAALQNTGLSKFDLLINDSCLMSNVDHYGLMAKYFDYAIGSPETTFNPSFDMTLLLNELNDNPNIDIGKLGKDIADKYIVDMAQFSPNQLPIVTANVTDLRNYDDVVNAIEGFAGLVNENPDAYASFLGQVRSNTYIYSFFMPEDQFGPQTNIDIGDFMNVVIANSNDRALVNAAQGVVNAMRASLMYGTAGEHVVKWTSYYNAYFPARGTDFNPNYVEETPLQNWAQMLRNFYGSVSPQSRGFRGVQGAPPLAPSAIPNVRITNIFPQETSVAFPTTVSMEVTGRNIAQGNFTVDWISPNGTAVRLETSRIVTEVVENNVVDFVNKWNPGVDDSDFTWDVKLPVVSDGQTSQFEQVVTSDGVSSIAGRYQYPGQTDWVDVTVIFDDDGNTGSVMSRNPGSQALANVTLRAGGTFQSYLSVVTPDGRIELQEGTSYNWPENGITWEYQPAPTGNYNLGFLIEAVGGVTGFASTPVKVNNDNINPDLRGYVDDDWGFIFQHPSKDWFSVSYFPDSDFLQTSNFDNSDYMFVYPVYETEDNLQGIAQSVLDKFSLDMDGRARRFEVAGKDALEFRFNYSNDSGDFSGHAFAVYIEDLQLGLVFSAEATDERRTDDLYQLFLDHLSFFDAQAIKAQDTGVWGSDTYTAESSYPVREDWLPGFENGLWWTYAPDNAENSATFANVTVLVETEDDAKAVLESLLSQEVESKDGYKLLGQEVYYGELNTWETARFTHDGPNGEEVTGQLYVTVKNNTPYVLWFGAPSREFTQAFEEVFTVMLDGFEIKEASES